jgi:hypothetical protein
MAEIDQSSAALVGGHSADSTPINLCCSHAEVVIGVAELFEHMHKIQLLNILFEWK